jgi:hypothetical protein
MVALLIVGLVDGLIFSLLLGTQPGGQRGDGTRRG